MRIRDFILAGVAVVSIGTGGATSASAQVYPVQPYFDNPAACWDYGWSDIYSYPYCGWYDGFFYPGSGFYVYDRGGHRHHWNSSQQSYWTNRRSEAGGNPRFPGSGGSAQSPRPVATAMPGSPGGTQTTRPTGTVRPGSSGGIQLSQPVYNPGPRNSPFNGAGRGAFGGTRSSGVGRVGGGGNHGSFGGFGGGGFGGGGFHGSFGGGFGGFGGGGFGGGGFHGGGGGGRR